METVTSQRTILQSPRRGNPCLRVGLTDCEKIQSLADYRVRSGHRLGVGFSARGLLLQQRDPTVLWKWWSGLRSVGERFPPLVRSRFPRPRGVCVGCREASPSSRREPCGTPPKRVPDARFSHPPHSLSCKSANPLVSRSAPPRSGSSSFATAAALPPPRPADRMYPQANGRRPAAGGRSTRRRRPAVRFVPIYEP